MKCDNCEAMQNTSYEYKEYECVLGIDECEFKDGTYGCRHKAKTIQKMLENMEEARAAEYSAMADFFEAEEKKDNALMQAIKEVLFANSHCICWKSKDGSLNECNAESLLQHHCWEIRSKFEAALQAMQEGEC